MPADRKPVRFAHTAGHTDLCYSDDGKNILTCGTEGDLRIWAGYNDDSQMDKCIGDVGFAIAQKGNKIYIGTDNNSVQIFSYPDAELEGMLTRFTAPVTNISVSEDGKFVVASSRDMEIHICNTTTDDEITISGHSAPVLSVAVDPKHEYIVSSSCDGSVRVWQIADQLLVKEWDDALPPSKSFTLTRSLCRMAWQPKSGRYLAIPYQDKVVVFERESWKEVYTFTDPMIGSQLFSICCWSSCGKFIAGSTTSGDILIWNLPHTKLIEACRQKKGVNVCSLVWNPVKERKEIAFCDFEGNFGIIENCYPDIIEEEVAKTTESEKVNDYFSEPPQFDDDEEDDDNDISLDKIKSQYPLEEDLLSDKVVSSIREGSESRLSIASGPEKPLLPNIALQAPFQPSSTPLHLNHRFMLWNSIGAVYHYNTGDENAIQVEFHDAEFHYMFRIDNVLNHHIAALGLHALVLACESQNNSPSKLVCVLLKAWDGNKEWSVELPEDEEAVCVAVGSSWVAVTTDARILRVYTLAGCQKQIISLPGPIVCMAGFQNQLIVVYHSAITIPNDQALAYTVYNVNNLYSRSLSQPLPLTPKSELRWLGFTDEGSICTTDSAGMLRILVNSSVWQPICNVDAQTKNKLDHNFVVGVSEQFKNIRCLLCKGAVYPRTAPKPVVSEILWKIPLCETNLEKGQLEDKLWQLILVHRNLKALQNTGDTYKETLKVIHKDILATGLKLFSVACKNDSDMRALEICEMISDKVFLQLVMKYVENKGRSSLMNRLSQIDIKEFERERERSPSPSHNSGSHVSNSMQRKPLMEPKPFNHSNKEELSQDVFGEENEENCEENLILAYKKRKATENLSLNVSVAQKGVNPFKKKNMNGENEGLDALNSITKKDIVIKNSFSFDKKLSSRKLKKNNEEKPSKKMSFLEWFELEKPNLQEEFPELDLADLTKTAMKRFKSLKLSSQDNSPAQSTSLKGRKDLKSFFSSTSNSNSILDDSQKSLTLEDSQKTELGGESTLLVGTENDESTLDDSQKTEFSLDLQNTAVTDS